jgi:hypothetical protein
VSAKGGISIIVVVLAICAGVVIGIYFKPSPPIQTVIIDEIKNISELATVSYHVTKLEERNPDPEGILYEKVKVLLVWPGWVKAGVDLKKAEFSFDEDSRTLSIKLPPAEILSATPDSGGFKSYVVQRYGTGVGKDPSGSQVAKWAGEHADQLKSEAEKVDILGLALEEAKKTITVLTDNLGIHVEFLE